MVRFDYITEGGKTLSYDTFTTARIYEKPPQMWEDAMTLGEQRVRLDFNPSGDARVHEITKAAAHLIDMVIALDQGGGDAHMINERKRCILFAEYYIEDAAMWAVKAATLK